MDQVDDPTIAENNFAQNKKRGWIKSYRSTLSKKSWLRTAPRCRFLFETILKLVDYEDAESGGIQTKQAGRLVTKISSLATLCGFTRQETRGALLRLSKRQVLTIKTTNKETIIFVNNWSTYQGIDDVPNHQINHQATIKQPSSNHQTTTLQELKNSRIEEFKKKEVPKVPTLGAQVWQVYEEAYQAKFQTPPLRNAKVNSVCKKLAQELGLEAAQKLVRFYVAHPSPFYAQRGYPLELALKDAQALTLQQTQGYPHNGPQNRSYGLSGVSQTRPIPPLVGHAPKLTPEEVEARVEKDCPDCGGSGLRNEQDEAGVNYRCRTCSSFKIRDMDPAKHKEHPLQEQWMRDILRRLGGRVSQ